MRKDYTHIAMVLDRSGSMSDIKDDTIGGVNEFINSQKSVPGDCTMTLVQFDHVIETVFANTPVKSVQPLTGKTYQPRNSTALLDAVGKTIDDTGKFLGELPESHKAEKVVFVIVTDGMENSSCRFTRKQIFDKITHQREVYKWEFVFIGANQDAFAEAQAMGMSPANAMNYTDNQVGTHAVYTSMSANVRSFRVGAKADMSFEAEDHKKQADAKTKVKTKA